MEYRNFVDTLIEMVKDKTGIEKEKVFFQEADEFLKEDSILIIFGEGKNDYYCCRISAGELYGNYQSGHSMEQLADKIAEEICRAKEMKMKEKIELLRDYKKAKEILFVRLINYENNREELKNALYRRVGEIALTVYFKIGEDHGTLVSGKVDRNFIREWGKNVDEVFSEAMENTMRMTPPRIYRFEKMLMDPAGYEGEDFMNPESDVIINKDAMGNCISTTIKTNGAAVIFGKGVAKRLSDAMDAQDLYLVFTAIHEVMVHNAATVHPEDLERVLMETIKEATPREDFLARHIYKYCRKDNQIIMLPLSGER